MLERVCPRCPFEAGKQLVFRVRNRAGYAHERLVVGTISWPGAARVAENHYPERVTPCKLVHHGDGSVALGVSDRSVPWRRKPGAAEPDRVPSPVPPPSPAAPRPAPSRPSRLERFKARFRRGRPSSSTAGSDRAPGPLARRAVGRTHRTPARGAAPPTEAQAPGRRDFVAWSYEFGNGRARHDRFLGFREFRVEAAELRGPYTFEYLGVSARTGVFEIARRIGRQRPMDRARFVRELERVVLRTAAPAWQDFPTDLGHRQ